MFLTLCSLKSGVRSFMYLTADPRRPFGVLEESDMGSDAKCQKKFAVSPRPKILQTMLTNSLMRSLWNFLAVSNSEAKSELPPADFPSVGLPDQFMEVQFFIQFMTMNLSPQGQSRSVLALPSVILSTILVNHICSSLPNPLNLAAFKSVLLLLN